jgi:hypothetical protein
MGTSIYMRILHNTSLFTESWAFLNSLSYALSHCNLIFMEYLSNAEPVIIIRSIVSIPITLTMLVLNFEGRIFDKVLYQLDSSHIP